MTGRDAPPPPAPEEMERRAMEIFPLDMDPEEFAAKDGYGWLGFTFADYAYRDKTLQAWLYRVGEIIRTPALLEACQKKYLTEAERRQIRAYLDDDFED
jgi:hypothetical protein